MNSHNNDYTDIEKMAFWSGLFINSLKENEIFVFGSNPEGIHGAGGAKAALEFGAKLGKGRGLEGQTYALVTKNLNKGFQEKNTGIIYQNEGFRSVSRQQIEKNIDELYQCALEKPNKRFLITFQYETWENGQPKKSLNGYTSEEIFKMFLCKNIPVNIVFHNSYEEKMKKIFTSEPKENSFQL